jgi:hypothetical protein
MPAVMVSLNLWNGSMIVRGLRFYQVANEIGADYFSSRGIYAGIQTKFGTWKLPWLVG